MVPRRPPRPCRWTAPPGGGCQTSSRRAWEVSRLRRADRVQAAHPYIPYYNRAAVLTCAASGRCASIWYVLECVRALADAPAWRGRYNCIDGTKHTINACVWLYCSRAKIKALHPQRMQGKRKAPPAWAGWKCAYYAL